MSLFMVSFMLSVTFFVMLSVIMLTVIYAKCRVFIVMLIVIMLSVNILVIFGRVSLC